MDLFKLTTEARNPNTMMLDKMGTMEMLRTINQEDKLVADAVEGVLAQIGSAVDHIYLALKQGGRLIYCGAGASGRLGVTDAAECPPTFMADAEMVQAIMAGGNQAFIQAAENAEDDAEAGRRDLAKCGLTKKDAVVGITASGRTPYPIGALKYARTCGAYTVSLSCNMDAEISKYANTAIEVIVGPEVLTGSTRMKAASAHKMVLNMISTAVMVRLGKVYENLMIDVHASNKKLKERAKHILTDITGISYQAATAILVQTDFEVKPAIVMIKSGADLHAAKQAIAHCSGNVRDAIRYAEQRA